jgi:acetaldehyde/propanal dehydrogenase
MGRINAALIGSGNIGTDLMYKALRSSWLRPVWMVGIDPASEGLARAREHGLATSAEGVAGLLPHLARDGIRIAFDATSAAVHADNAAKLSAHGVVMIDLTPAAIGPYCVPPVNLSGHVGKREMNVNMVSCGGQATIPMVAVVSACSRRVRRDRRHGLVASVGPGTRQNIDEFTRTTAEAVEKRRRRQARQGHHHHQPRRAAAHHARHHPLPHRGRAGPGGIRARPRDGREVQRYVPGYS